MKLNHVAIVVSDIKTAKEFYKKYLNAECVIEEVIEGEQFSKVTAIKDIKLRFAALTLPDSEINIELVQFLNPKREIANDFRHIAFEVDDVDRYYQAFKQDGIKVLSEPTTIVDKNPKINGKRMFYFLDPDENIIELFNAKENLYSN